MLMIWAVTGWIAVVLVAIIVTFVSWIYAFFILNEVSTTNWSDHLASYIVLIMIIILDYVIIVKAPFFMEGG